MTAFMTKKRNSKVSFKLIYFETKKKKSNIRNS